MKTIKGKIDTTNLSEDQKDVVREIIEFVNQRKNIPFEMIEHEMRQKFNLDQIPLRNIKDSELYKIIKSMPEPVMEFSYQGYIEQKNKDGSIYREPFICISGSLQQFEEMIKSIKGD
jgi:hypothetical protein